jgi:hypothetical protein
MYLFIFGLFSCYFYSISLYFNSWSCSSVISFCLTCIYFLLFSALILHYFFVQFNTYLLVDFFLFFRFSFVIPWEFGSLSELSSSTLLLLFLSSVKLSWFRLILLWNAVTCTPLIDSVYVKLMAFLVCLLTSHRFCFLWTPHSFKVSLAGTHVLAL